MPVVSVIARDGRTEFSRIEVSDRIFAATRNIALIHQAVKAQRTNMRQLTRDTLTRGGVSGGGKKPFKQKGTGRSRQGSIIAPHWRHGGTAHGPHPRTVVDRIPRQMRQGAIWSSLSAKLTDGEMVFVEEIPLDGKISTKTAAAFLREATGGAPKSLVIVEKSDEIIYKSLRNIQGVTIRVGAAFSTLDVVDAGTIVITVPAVRSIEKTWDYELQDEYDPAEIHDADLQRVVRSGTMRRDQQTDAADQPSDLVLHQEIVSGTSFRSDADEEKQMSTLYIRLMLDPKSPLAAQSADAVAQSVPVEARRLDRSAPVRRSVASRPLRLPSGEYFLTALLPGGGELSGRVVVEGATTAYLRPSGSTNSLSPLRHELRSRLKTLREGQRTNQTTSDARISDSASWMRLYSGDYLKGTLLAEPLGNLNDIADIGATGVVRLRSSADRQVMVQVIQEGRAPLNRPIPSARDFGAESPVCEMNLARLHSGNWKTSIRFYDTVVNSLIEFWEAESYREIETLSVEIARQFQGNVVATDGGIRFVTAAFGLFRFNPDYS